MSATVEQQEILRDVHGMYWSLNSGGTYNAGVTPSAAAERASLAADAYCGLSLEAVDRIRGPLTKCTKGQTWAPTIENCDGYLGQRTGNYEQRAIRYRAAADWLFAQGLDDTMTVLDVGAGMTEFDYCLRAEYNWRGRYIPVDGGIDGTNLNEWIPPREVDFIVALEIVEHLVDYNVAMLRWRRRSRGVIISTPNPRTTDVLGMDPTHVAAITAEQLQAHGFLVTEETFYGGVFSAGQPDSLLATWRRP